MILNTRLRYSKNVFLALIISCYQCIASHEVTANEPVMVFTENLPITSPTVNNPSGGEASRFVKLLLEEAGIDYQLHILPWRRSYLKVQTHPNTMIYPMARTPTREDQFHWVGELLPIQYYLYRLKTRTDIKMETLADARNYKIGVVNYYAMHEYLLDKNIHSVEPVNSSEQNIKKLLLGRIDLFVASDSGILPMCRRINVDCELITPAFKLADEISGLYLAFSQGTDPELIEKAKLADAKLKEQGVHREIFSNRFNDLEGFYSLWSDDIEMTIHPTQ